MYKMSQQEFSLKAYLVRCLNEIKILNSVLKFCDLVRNADYLLIKQSQVPREEESDCQHVHSDIASIWEQLKAEIKPKKVVALKILQILYVKEDTSDLTRKFVSLVSEIDDDDEHDAENYVGRLVNAMNSLTVSTITGKLEDYYVGISLEPKTKDTRALQVYLRICRLRETKNLLLVLCSIGMEKLDFTEEEKNEIGNLLIEAIDPIHYFIAYTVLMASSRLKPKYLKFRSALQYFTDVYVKFPCGKKALGEVVNMVKIKRSIFSFDRLISELWDDYESDETFSDFEKAGASKVPESHTWWPKNGSYGFIYYF